MVTDTRCMHHGSYCWLFNGTTEWAKDSSDKGRNKTIKVGFSVSTLNNPFFVTLKKGAEKKAKDSGIELIAVDAQNDAAKQTNDVEDLIQKGVDVIVINPTDSDAVASAVSAANAANVPVIVAQLELGRRPIPEASLARAGQHGAHHRSGPRLGRSDPSRVIADRGRVDEGVLVVDVQLVGDVGPLTELEQQPGFGRQAQPRRRRRRQACRKGGGDVAGIRGGQLVARERGVEAHTQGRIGAVRGRVSRIGNRGACGHGREREERDPRDRGRDPAIDAAQPGHARPLPGYDGGTGLAAFGESRRAARDLAPALVVRRSAA